MAKKQSISVPSFDSVPKILEEILEDITTEVSEAGKPLTGKNIVRIKSEAKALKSLSGSIRADFIKEMTKGAASIQDELYNVIVSNIETPMWPWRNPKNNRKSGSLLNEDSSPRDIVDTGKLQNSNVVQVKYLQSGFKIEIRNKQPYSGIVHWGGYIRPYGNNAAEKVWVQGRPWVLISMGIVPSGNYSIPASYSKIDVNARIVETYKTALSKAIAKASSGI